MARAKSKPTQALRYNNGKPLLSYLLDFPAAMKEFVKICEGGAEKYARHNWKKGFPITELEDSLLRHLEKFHNCVDTDPESAAMHAGHVLWNAAAIIEVLDRYGDKFDNRDHENEDGRHE